MNAVRMLAAWSFRRMCRRIRRLRLFLSITVDWLILLYLVLPGAALLAWLLFRYSQVSMWWPWFAGVAARLHLSAVWLAVVVIGLGVYIPHSRWFGEAAMPLEPADAPLLLLSPLSRRAILCTLWLETFALTLPGALIAGALTAPLARAVGVSLAVWVGWTLGWGLYEASVRLVSHASRPRDGSSWRRRLSFFAGRYLSYLVAGWSVRWLVVAGRTGQDAVLGLWWGTGLLAAAATMLLLPRADWDALFVARTTAWLDRWFPQDDDHPARVRYFLRRLPASVARLLDSVVPGGLAPTQWLLVVRALRRPGYLRDLLYISGVAVGATRAAPAVIRWLSLIFFAVLLYEWWSISVAPLYRSPVRHQTVVDPWRLERPVARWRVGFVVLVFAAWMVLAGTH